MAMSFAPQSSKIDGVQIGAITYSFRQGVDKKTLPAVFQSIGLSEAELMSGDAEIIAGIPTASAPGPGSGGGDHDHPPPKLRWPPMVALSPVLPDTTQP